MQKCFDTISAALSSFSPQNGFPNRTDSSISFVNGTRTFTIQPTGASFSFFSGGVKFVKSTPQTVVISNTHSLWYIYFDLTGTLAATTTFTEAIITTYCFVASVYWDAIAGESLLVGEERHGSEMDSYTHLYLHSSFGTQFGSPVGFALTGVVADGNGDLDTSAQVGINGGSIWDEDIKHILGTVAAPASLPVFYLTGTGVWRRVAATAYPLPYQAGSLAQWNQFQGGTWSLVTATSDDFVLSHIFVTNDHNQPYIVIAGQSTYSTLTAAREGANTEIASIVTTGLPTVEFAPVATLIWETRTSYANAPKSRIRFTTTGAPYIDWRSSNSIAQGGATAALPAWGSITGTLASQIDLNTALSNKQPLDADLTAIAALAGTSGFLKKTAADTWALDTNTYITTTNLKDTGELVYDLTEHQLTISGAGGASARKAPIEVVQHRH